jgi:heat-inducible transcriptional repressor
MTEIDTRTREILCSIISACIYLRQPIGSRTLKKRYSLDISPATIRNIMADLEELGFLTQLHTSSGRVPTEKGYRFYVDTLLRNKRATIDEETLHSISERLDFMKNDISQLSAEASKILAIFSKYLAVVMPADIEDMVLKILELINFRKNHIICIVITEEGMLTNRIIKVDKPLTEQNLKKLMNFLNSLFGGLTIREIRKRVIPSTFKELMDDSKLPDIAFNICKEALKADNTHFQRNRWIAGASNISDFVSAQQIKEFFLAIENNHLLVHILERILETEDVQVFIGSENIHKSLKDMTVVVSPFKDKFHTIGTVGVIGPTMMNYERIISIVSHTAKTITGILSEI